MFNQLSEINVMIGGSRAVIEKSNCVINGSQELPSSVQISGRCYTETFFPY